MHRKSDTLIIDDILHMPINRVITLPPKQLYQAQQEAIEVLRKAELMKEWLEAAIAMKYRKITAGLRKQQGKESGIVSFYDDSYLITSSIPETITWDQELLTQAMQHIVNKGDDPADYASITLHVSEKHYAAFPDSIRMILEPARKVELGLPVFVIKTRRTA
jgi:hypothetical protein